MANRPPLRMGWFIPTLGDTTACGDPEKEIPQSMEHFLRVAIKWTPESRQRFKL